LYEQVAAWKMAHHKKKKTSKSKGIGKTTEKKPRGKKEKIAKNQSRGVLWCLDLAQRAGTDWGKTVRTRNQEKMGGGTPEERGGGDGIQKRAFKKRNRPSTGPCVQKKGKGRLGKRKDKGPRRGESPQNAPRGSHERPAW